jgi:hypothetical protein
MKKIILIAIAVLTFGFTYAQKAQFGIKGGLNIASQNYSGDGAPSPSSMIGFNIGGFVDFIITDKFSIQPELLYSTQGSKFNMFVNDGGTDFNTENTFKLSYINIPILFKYYASEKFSLEAGPQIGFLTSSKLEVKVLKQTVTQDAKTMFESLDYGLNFGAGYDIAKNISAGVRYNFGLANVMKTESGDNSKIKNSVFLLSIGYKFK